MEQIDIDQFKSDIHQLGIDLTKAIEVIKREDDIPNKIFSAKDYDFIFGREK